MAMSGMSRLRPRKSKRAKRVRHGIAARAKKRGSSGKMSTPDPTASGVDALLAGLWSD